MKTRMFSRISLFLVVVLLSGFVVRAQQPSLQYFRSNDKNGLNVFETPKRDSVVFDGLKVRVGGAFALQYQALSHENDADNLVELDNNFNLATANLDLDVQLYDGVRMHLRTFLSARHHEESWVKGGYLQIDKLDFIKEGFLSNFMKNATIRIGHMENNYGDAHFRRTDNGHALYNPFVGNYLMDSYTTEVGGELYYQTESGILAMLGFTNGRLNQSTTNDKTKAVLLGKVGYDNQVNDDLRVRITGSIFYTNDTDRINLYSGDRAGGRYYNVMDTVGAAANDFSGRINPGFANKMTSFMINPFVKFKGLEFFGIYENASGRNEARDAAFTDNRTWNQLAAELIYRIGVNERVFVGARYNTVSGQLPGVESDKVSINRINLGGGWFMTKNVLTKIEYVTQSYNDYAPSSPLYKGKFSGVVIEAVIAF